VPDRAWIDNVRRTRLWEGAGRQRQQPWASSKPKPEKARGWTYREACDAWLEHLQAEAAVGNLTTATIRNYRTVIRSPAMRALDGRQVARIEAANLAAVVAYLAGAGKRSKANDTARFGKRLWGWMAEPGQERRSGVAPGVIERVRAPKLGSIKARQISHRSPRSA
jgi:hypothetical protein